MDIVVGDEKMWELARRDVDSTHRQMAGVVDSLRNDYSGMPS